MNTLFGGANKQIFICNRRILLFKEVFPKRLETSVFGFLLEICLGWRKTAKRKLFDGP